MAYRLINILSLLCAIAIVVLFRFDLIQKIPGFHCESFGCMGLGILLIISPVPMAILFFVGGLVFAKKHRLKTGVAAACISFAFAVMAVIVVGVWNKMEVNRAVEKACRENPIYCPAQ